MLAFTTRQLSLTSDGHILRQTCMCIFAVLCIPSPVIDGFQKDYQITAQGLGRGCRSPGRPSPSSPSRRADLFHPSRPKSLISGL